MKQLLFLLLFPCLALAQYTGNGNQKITLGEQTTADGLVFRGIRADTASKIVPFSDTSAYIILDTMEKTLWLYKAGQIPKWQQVGGSTLDTATMLLPYYRSGKNTIIKASDVPTLNQNTTGSAATLTTGRTIQTNLASTSAATFNGSANITPGVTGTLPVANGGTNAGAFNAGSVVFAGASGTYAQDNSGLFFDPTNNRLGIGVANPSAFALEINGGIKFDAGTSTSGLFMKYATEPVKTRLTRGASGTALTENWDSVAEIKDDTLKPSYMFFLLSNNTPLGCSICDAFEIRRSEPTNNKDFTPIFKLNNTGVLIKGGTANPEDALHVVGNARITGNILAGVTSATARLHLAAGTATVSTAPLKFTSGVNLTTAEAGSMEFNGTNLFFSPSTTRHTVNHGLTGSRTIDFPSRTTLLSADETITVTGAADGDVVSLGVPHAAVNANTCYTAWVSAANTVTVRFNNYSSGTVNPASGLFKVFVTK